MTRNHVTFLGAMIVMAMLVGFSEPAHAEGTWRAGVARADITPGEPMWLAGYGGRDHESEGALHPLWAKALALEDASGQRALLVTTDTLGFPRGMSDAIRNRLKSGYQLERAQILLCGSHTHTGPVLRDSLYTIYPLTPDEIAKIDRYSQTLEDQIVALAGEAIANLAPARLASGNGVTRFAVNRRNNAEGQILDLHELKGPSDHAVPALKVQREDGALLAVVFGYACHATTLSFYQWSGDYPGFAQIALEDAHPGVTALFFAGCGADQNPMPRRTVALARQYGRELADAVERALADPMKPLDPVLRAAYSEIGLALAPPPSREELVKLAEGTDIYRQRAAKQFLAQLDRGESLETSCPYPLQIWRLGDQTLVAMAGEVVVDYAIAIKSLLGRDTFVAAYANHLTSYIPSERVLHEGGYEGVDAQMLYGHPSPWKDDVESRIMDGVRALAVQTGLTPKPAAN